MYKFSQAHVHRLLHQAVTTTQHNAREREKSKSISINKRFVQVWIWMQSYGHKKNTWWVFIADQHKDLSSFVLVCSHQNMFIQLGFGVDVVLFNIADADVVVVIVVALCILCLQYYNNKRVHVSCIAFVNYYARMRNVHIKIYYVYNNVLSPPSSSSSS